MDWVTIDNVPWEHELVEARALDYASFFREHLKNDDIVLIILKESIDLFSSFLGALSNKQVPAYFAYPSEKQTKEFFIESIKNLLKYNDIKLVVTYDEVKEILSDFDLNIITTDVVPFVSSILDPIEYDDNCSFIQFSSGTTGAKKAVKIKFSSLINQISSYIKHLNLYEDSVIVSWLPHYHDMGLIACMLLPYLTRTKLIMMSPFDWVKKPEILLDAIQEYKGTHVWLPNFALGHMCNNVKEPKRYDLSSLKMITLCSEPVLENTLNKFIETFNVKDDIFYNCYAMAENTFAVTTTDGGKIKFKDGIASVGKSIDGATVNVIGTEIVVMSNCLADGYYNNPEKTEESFMYGWYKTGDSGFVHDGELYVTGRLSDLIIVGGENIFATDIEEILNNTEYLIPGRNLAFGITDEELGTEKIIILAETDNKNKVNKEKIRKQCKDKLGISIAEIILLPIKTLYKSTAGKISRTVNRDQYLSGNYNEFKNVYNVIYESQLSRIINEKILLDEKIHLKKDTKLISSGILDSFSVVQLLTLLEKHYGINISTDNVEIKDFETINDIMNLIRRNQ